ncbi:hypothetical protein GGTG_04370 [Gaeumannomyces tritici R3-111a-1]|uniref:F-box domain-containing protein n=1 Tax=Gaeumannomyces tritici (strain R3-111a-1) TaxID=644352 RepID=J3NSX1_GAET3|nr:hypothetical protein GGTG_04370 [Gaeumannomyces tritici R3-111a-1]EJT79284.1 hypothetical protein GGTG_04370 [Gaeumannomyces tritici R3-111a-1]
MAPPFLTIPDELLLNIFYDCDMKRKTALVRVNRHLYHKLNPHLYIFNVRNERSSALVWAAWTGNFETMKLAWDARDDNNSWDYIKDYDVTCRWSSLFPKGFHEQTNLAVAYGWEPMDGFSPLHLAASQGNTEMVAWMLSHGARIDSDAAECLKCKNLFYDTYIQEVSGYPPSLYFGKDHTVSPLHLAICHGHMSTAELLIKHGASTVTCANVGSSAMHDASLAGRIDIMRYLAANHPGILHSVDKSGMSALHHAAFSPAGASVVPVLVELGLDINGQDQSGATSLHLATCLGNVQAAIAMVDAGAAISTWKAKRGRTCFTPLQVACWPPRFTDLVYGFFGFEQYKSNGASLRRLWEERRQVLLQKMLEKGDTDINASMSLQIRRGFLHSCSVLRAAISEPICIFKMLLDAGAEPLPDTAYYLLSNDEWSVDKEAKFLLLQQYGLRLDAPLSSYNGTLLEYVVNITYDSQFPYSSASPSKFAFAMFPAYLVRLLIKRIEVNLHSSREHLTKVALKLIEKSRGQAEASLKLTEKSHGQACGEFAGYTFLVEAHALLVEAGASIEPRVSKPWIEKLLNNWLTHCDDPRYLRPETITLLLGIFPTILSAEKLLINALISFGTVGHYHASQHDINRCCRPKPSVIMTLLGLIKGPITVKTPLTGRSALHFATACAHCPAMESLLLRGQDPNVSDKFGITPLHNLLAFGHVSPEGKLHGLDVLLEHGADPFHVVAATPDMVADDGYGLKVPKPNPSQYTALEISLYHNRGMSQMLQHVSLADIPASRIPSFTVNCISLCLSRTARLTSFCELAKAWGEVQPEKCADLNKALLEVLRALWDTLADLNGPKRTLWSVVAEKLAIYIIWLFCTNTTETSRGDDGVDDVWGCIASHMASRNVSRPAHQEWAPLDTVLDRFFELQSLPSGGRTILSPRPLDFAQPRGDVFQWLDGLVPQESLFDDSNVCTDQAPTQERLSTPAREPAAPTEGLEASSEHSDTTDGETEFTPGIEGQGPIGMEIWVRLQVLHPFRLGFLERVKQLRA